VLYAPGAQREQVETVIPVPVPYFPAEQSAQTETPATEL
jgi:hypothetical protein